MGVGTGVVWSVLGLVLVLRLGGFDVGVVNETDLGWVLLVAGILSIALALVLDARRARSRLAGGRRQGKAQ